MPHTRTAIDAAFATASLLVDVARLNSHRVPYDREVELVIDNYDRHFLPAEGGAEDPDDPLPDTMWFIPEPKHARKDPEPIPDGINTAMSDIGGAGGGGAAEAVEAAWEQVQKMLWRDRAHRVGMRE